MRKPFSFAISLALLGLMVFSDVGCQKQLSEEEILHKERELQKLFLQEGQKINDRIVKKTKDLIHDFQEFAKTNPEKRLEYLLKSAGLYQSVLNQPKEAITIYDQIIQEYKGQKGADRALFMAGYLYHNELGDTVKARAYYEALIQKYPNSPFVTHAQQELQFLGIPPEELAKKYLQGVQDTIPS